MDVHDIIERDISDVPIQAPNISHVNQEKPRKTSRWKSRVSSQTSNLSSRSIDRNQQPSMTSTFGENMSEEEKIHLENLKKLSSMRSEEIEHERQQIMDMMNPDILQSLLRRAELKEQDTATSTDATGSHVHENVHVKLNAEKSETAPTGTPPATPLSATYNKSKLHADTTLVDQSYETAADVPNPVSNQNVHFLRPERVSMDVNDPDFLSKLHDKYFPELEVESDKIEWMRPIDESGPEGEEYSPEQASLAPSEIRFDFRGDIVTPRRSRQIESNQGLHHHGDAPLAAGYTIGELGHLARSTNQSQRCLAIQTLGRLLYKLGNVKNSQLHAGLQGCIDQYRIIESLTEATSDKNSLSTQAYATEALWYYTQKDHRNTRIAI